MEKGRKGGEGWNKIREKKGKKKGEEDKGGREENR